MDCFSHDVVVLPLLLSNLEVLFDDARNFKLNVHYRLEKHVDDLLSVRVKLIVNRIELHLYLARSLLNLICFA